MSYPCIYLKMCVIFSGLCFAYGLGESGKAKALIRIVILAAKLCVIM